MDKKYQVVDTKKLYHKNIFWVSLWLAQFFLFFFLSKSEDFVNLIQKLFLKTQSIRTSIFGWLPFSVGDLFYILITLGIIAFIYFIFKRKYRKRALKTLLIFLNIIFFYYQIVWGILYFQKPLLSRSDLKQEINTEELKSLANYYKSECEQLRSNQPNLVFKITSLEKIKQEIQLQQQQISKEFHNEPEVKVRLKPSLFSGIMNYSGILGYYNPFTSESQYNDQLPDSYIPFTLAHESAHQIGFAREEEANYIGYLVGENTTNPELKYSTYWFALKNILFNLSDKEKDFVKNFIKDFPEPLKIDYLAEKKFRKEHQGKMEDFFSFTNDLFLKSNQQDGSISYNYFIYLLLQHHKTKGLHLKMQSQKHK